MSVVGETADSRKSIREAMEALKNSYGWQILMEKLKEDRRLLLEQTMKISKIEDLMFVKGNVQAIGALVSTPDYIIETNLELDHYVKDPFDPDFDGKI